MQRYELCDRCSKPVFFDKDKTCKRCSPAKTGGSSSGEDDGVLRAGDIAAIPICSPTKIRGGEFYDQWGVCGPEGAQLKEGQEVEIRTKSGKRWRTEVTIFIESAPWGETWATPRNKPNLSV